MKFLTQDFEKKHPGVDWVRNDVPFDQALKQATVATLAGNAADNIHLIAGWVPAIYEIGGLEPLNDYFTAEEWADIPKASLDSVTFDGKIMAMPWVPGPIIMFYNRNLMKEAGLDPAKPPQTWPELMEQAKKIAALPARDGAPVYGVALRTQRNPNSAQWTIPIIYGMGGDVVDAQGKVTFNTPADAAGLRLGQGSREGRAAPGRLLDRRDAQHHGVRPRRLHLRGALGPRALQQSLGRQDHDRPGRRHLGGADAGRPERQAADDRQSPRDHHLQGLQAQEAGGRVHPLRDLRPRVHRPVFQGLGPALDLRHEASDQRQDGRRRLHPALRAGARATRTTIRSRAPSSMR